MGNEPHDALAVGCSKALAGIREAPREPIDPEPTVGIEHHLDDDGIFEPSRNRWSERGAQHARTTRYDLGLEGMNCHHRPQHAERKRARRRGSVEKADHAAAQQDQIGGRIVA